MKAESITSPKNPLLKNIRKAIVRGSLTDDGLAVAESFHLLEEALRSDCSLQAVIAAETIQSAITAHVGGMEGVRVFTVPDILFRQISSTESPQGVIALVRPRAWTLEQALRGQALAVVLDGLQEPGNAGAILRAAEAFGASGAIFLKGAVNPYNPKAMRASAGSIFRLPCVSGIDVPVLEATLEQKRIRLLAALPAGGTDAASTDLTQKVALVIGSEGRGVSADLARKAHPVRIPTTGVESLNAAVAAGILLYEARRQRMLEQ